LLREFEKNWYRSTILRITFARNYFQDESLLPSSWLDSGLTLQAFSKNTANRLWP
jgi:hypothetical protein